MNKSVVLCLLGLLVGIIVGYLFGKKTMKISEEVTYEKLPTYKVFIPIKKTKIERLTGNLRFSDTKIPSSIVFPEDMTNEQLRQTTYDWNKERLYNDLLVFDNQHGRLTIDATIQYNELKYMRATFDPIQKVVTRSIKPRWQPFVLSSYNSLGYVSIGGGLIYRNIGISGKYVTDFKQKGFDIGLLYLF